MAIGKEGNVKWVDVSLFKDMGVWVLPSRQPNSY